MRPTLTAYGAIFRPPSLASPPTTRVEALRRALDTRKRRTSCAPRQSLKLETECQTYPRSLRLQRGLSSLITARSVRALRIYCHFQDEMCPKIGLRALVLRLNWLGTFESHALLLASAARHLSKWPYTLAAHRPAASHKQWRRDAEGVASVPLSLLAWVGGTPAFGVAPQDTEVHPLYSEALRSSWALIATITVLADINTAPTAGARTIPAHASTPAASGIAMML